MPFTESPFPGWDGRTYNIKENPGLRNQDGTIYSIPSPFKKAGKTILNCTIKNFSTIYFFHDQELKAVNGEKEPVGNSLVL